MSFCLGLIFPFKWTNLLRIHYAMHGWYGYQHKPTQAGKSELWFTESKYALDLFCGQKSVSNAFVVRAPWCRSIIEQSSQLRSWWHSSLKTEPSFQTGQGSAGLPVSGPQVSHTSDPKCVMGESTNFWTSWTCFEFRVWTTMWPCVLKTTSWARAIPNCRCVSNQIYWFIDWLIDRDRQYPSTCIILCALCQRCEINYPTPWMLKSHITWDLPYWNHCLPFFLAWRFMRPLLTKS